MDAILNWTHETRAIPEAGLSITREATPEERQALADAMDLIACTRLVVRYAIKLIDQDRYRLKGDIAIDVTQACVVTLEPLDRRYTAPLNLELWPAELLAEEGETEIDALGPDLEPIEDGRIDVGRIVAEELASAIDPYPRKEGAAFEWEDKSAPARDNPFAALEKLKRKSD